MHFTGTVYRNPYWETFPLLQITQGCTHNKCKFCTMYRDVPFKVQPMEWIEQDLQEIASIVFRAGELYCLTASQTAQIVHSGFSCSRWCSFQIYHRCRQKRLTNR